MLAGWEQTHTSFDYQDVIREGPRYSGLSGVGDGSLLVVVQGLRTTCHPTVLVTSVAPCFDGAARGSWREMMNLIWGQEARYLDDHAQCRLRVLSGRRNVHPKIDNRP